MNSTEAGYIWDKRFGWRYFRSLEEARAGCPEGREFYPVDLWEETFFPLDNQPDPPARDDR